MRSAIERAEKNNSKQWAIQEGIAVSAERGREISRYFVGVKNGIVDFYTDYGAMPYGDFVAKWDKVIGKGNSERVIVLSSKSPFEGGNSVFDRIFDASCVLPYDSHRGNTRQRIIDGFENYIAELQSEVIERIDAANGDPTAEDIELARTLQHDYDHAEITAKMYYNDYIQLGKSNVNSEFARLHNGIRLDPFLGVIRSACRKQVKLQDMIDRGARAPEVHRTSDIAPIRSDIHAQGDGSLAPASDVVSVKNNVFEAPPSVIEDIAPIRKDIPVEPPPVAEIASSAPETSVTEEVSSQEAPVAKEISAVKESAISDNVSVPENAAQDPATALDPPTEDHSTKQTPDSVPEDTTAEKTAQTAAKAETVEERTNEKVARLVESIREGKTDNSIFPAETKRDRFLHDMFYDRIPASVKERIGAKLDSVLAATHYAKSLSTEGIEGVRPPKAIFHDAGINGRAFQKYLLHMLNIDHMTLFDRFEVDNTPVWKNREGRSVYTAEASQRISDQLRAAHPEFASLAQEVYDYNAVLRKLLVDGGVITQETARIWEERYPHYVPVHRDYFGRTAPSLVTKLSLFEFGSPPTVADVDVFLEGLDDVSSVHAFHGGKSDIGSIADAMVDRTFEVMWDVAKNKDIDYFVDSGLVSKDTAHFIKNPRRPDLPPPAVKTIDSAAVSAESPMLPPPAVTEKAVPPSAGAEESSALPPPKMDESAVPVVTETDKKTLIPPPKVEDATPKKKPILPPPPPIVTVTYPPPAYESLSKIHNTSSMFPDVTMATPERNRTYQQRLEISEELGSLVERDVLKDFELTIQERFGEGRKTALTQFEEYVIDNGFVFEKLSKKIRDRSLEASWNNIRNARARAEYLIAHGDAEKGVRSLMDIEKQIRKTGAANDFNTYMAYRAQADGLTIKQRTALFDNFSFAQDVSASDAQARVAALETIHPEFRALAADVDTYVANVQNLLVENHVIDQGTLDLWHELLPTYVPVQTTDAGIASITDSLADWTGKVERAVSTNSFAQKLESVLKTGKDGTDPFNFRRFVKSLEYGRMNDFSTTQDYQYRYYADGKMRTMEVTPEMYEAMKKSSAIWGTSIKGLSSFSDARRKIITEYNPYFLLKNAVRDIQDVIINSQHAVQTYGSIPRAMTEYFTKGALYQEYARNGGTANSYFQSDKKKLDLEKRSKAVQTIGKGLDCLSEANNFVEMMPRFAEYIASREMGRSVEVSLLDSARVTTNFAAGGKLTKLLNRNGCTFLNASVQGTTQFARNFYEAKTNGFKAWASLAGRLTIAGVLPEILNGLIWDDDDEYEEQPDYIKDNYFLIGKFGDGQFLRIPKGRAVAALNASMKYVSENPSGDDQMDFERYVKILADNLAPNNPFTDNVFAPAYQALVSKKTWYGEDITPRRLKDLPEDEQYDEKTSSLAIWLAEKIDGVNPKQVHYLLDNYSGVIGDMLLPLTTPKAESDIDNPFGKTLLAPLKNEFTTDSVLNSRIVGDFYDKMEAMDTKQQGARATKDEQALASHYIYANAEISKLFAQERQIQTSGLPDSEKYPKVRQIRKQILGIMRDTMNNQDVKRTGNYAVIGGSRYNYDPERKRWFKIQVKNADGSDNYYAKQEKQVTAALGISQEEYWNDRQKYDDIYYIGYGYDKDSAEDDSIITGKYVFGLDQFGSYAGKLKTFKADKDEHGESIPGTKKKKVKDYVYSLDIPETEKHILFKSQYKHENKHNYEIIDYLNEREDITYKQMEDILTELGMVVDSNGYITW